MDCRGFKKDKKMYELKVGSSSSILIHELLKTRINKYFQFILDVT